MSKFVCLFKKQLLFHNHENFRNSLSQIELKHMLGTFFFKLIEILYNNQMALVTCAFKYGAPSWTALWVRTLRFC